MPPRARRSLPSDDLCGSGQSLDSLAKDKAAQPGLLAAAAARKGKGKAPITTPDKPKRTIHKNKGKRVFVFHKAGSASSSGSPASSSGRRRQNKVSVATLTFMRAKYQKGDKSGQLTGTVYFRGKPRFGNNDTFKEKVNAKLLGNSCRWNDELKVYTAPVHTYEEAIMVREAMKMVSEKDEEDLMESAPTDEDIGEIFTFPEVKDTTISIINEFDVDGNTNIAIAGSTYPFKDMIKDNGFTFHRDGQMWIAPLGTDISSLEEKFDEYGFDVEKYDEAASASDAEDA